LSETMIMTIEWEKRDEKKRKEIGEEKAQIEEIERMNRTTRNDSS